jgi:hypothetical protein
VGISCAPHSPGAVLIDEPGREYAPPTAPGTVSFQERFGSESQFQVFSRELLQSLRALRPETADYYAACARKECSPVMFYNVPHVLVQASVDVSKATTISWAAEPA